MYVIYVFTPWFLFYLSLACFLLVYFCAINDWRQRANLVQALKSETPNKDHTMQIIEKRLAELDIALPKAAVPVGNYVAYTVSGSCVYVSGQLPIENGAMAVKGMLGDGLEVDDGYHAARLCALNLLAQLKAACDGNLDRVSRVLKLGGFVCSTPHFLDAPKCVNGASDLMVEVFGDAGRHARFAVGVASLPSGAAVEVDGIFEIRPPE